MPIIINQILKLVLPFLVKWLVQKAEEKFVLAKSGADKKAYVLKQVEDFVVKNGYNEFLNKEKLSGLVDKVVAEVINNI